MLMIWRTRRFSDMNYDDEGIINVGTGIDITIAELCEL